MNGFGERLARAGIVLVYHNHAFEYRNYNGKLGMEILYQHFNQNVQFEIDTFWVQKGGSNPVNWINKVVGKMDVVHFKDMGIRNWDEQYMAEVGSGNLNWDEIIKACLNNKVLWACVEQDDTQGRDPFECAKTSLEFLISKGF
jgi:sugar phosphate isomerase/epimerase